jgi:hypothetical protein
MIVLELLGFYLVLCLVGLAVMWGLFTVVFGWIGRSTPPQPGRRKRHLSHIMPGGGRSLGVARLTAAAPMTAFEQQAGETEGIQEHARHPSWWRSHLVALGYGLGVLLLVLASWRLLQPDAEAGVSGLRLMLVLGLWAFGGMCVLTALLHRLANWVMAKAYFAHIAGFAGLALFVILLLGLVRGWYGGHELSQDPCAAPYHCTGRSLTGHISTR